MPTYAPTVDVQGLARAKSLALFWTSRELKKMSLQGETGLSQEKLGLSSLRYPPFKFGQILASWGGWAN
jgi:hypothetical protein